MGLPWDAPGLRQNLGQGSRSLFSHEEDFAEPDRIQPGHPQQNGRPERMHLTLKNKTTFPADMNSLQQQAKFDDFIEEFNNERPHQALDMKCPAKVCISSTRPYR